MAGLVERRTHNIASLGVAGIDKFGWITASIGTDGSIHKISSREIDSYMNHTSPPISRQDFLARSEGWIRKEDMEKLYLDDFRGALGRLVSILLHRDVEDPEGVLKQKEIL